MTKDFSAWYASSMWAAVGFVTALALWGFHVALGGRKVLPSEFLDR